MVPPVASTTTFGSLSAAVAAPTPRQATTAAARARHAFVDFIIGFSLSASLLVLVLAPVEVRQLDRVEQIGDLLLVQDLLLADDLDDPLSALVGLRRQLGRLLVAEHGVEGGHDPDRGLHVVREHLLVEGD